jgi:putative CocE/NonD family hydrolase
MCIHAMAHTELISQVFLPAGFAGIEQDFRGTYQSGGEFDIWRACYNDTYDTIQWIIKQPWSNGVVHIAGASADGIAGLVLASQPPMPQIESQFIIWATAEPYSSVFPGG